MLSIFKGMSTLENVDNKYKRDDVKKNDITFFLNNLDTSYSNSFQLEMPKLKGSNNYYVQYSQFDHDLWINENDFVENNGNDGDDIELIHTQINTLFDDILYIIIILILAAQQININIQYYIYNIGDISINGKN